MVTARENDGSISLCIDLVHLNKALLKPHHPVKQLRTSSQTCQKLKYSLYLMQILVSGRYLDEESSLLRIFITHIGLYMFLRIPYGIKTGT